MYRQSKKNLLNSNTSTTCPHNMVNFGPLTAEIGSGVWDIPANFNGFRVLPSLLQRRRSPEANQTVHDVWPSPGLIHYIYIFGGSRPWLNFARRKIHFSQSLAFSYMGSVTARHSSGGRQPNCGVVQKIELRNFRRGLHLNSAGRPSPWAFAHIYSYYYVTYI